MLLDQKSAKTFSKKIDLNAENLLREKINRAA